MISAIATRSIGVIDGATISWQQRRRARRRSRQKGSSGSDTSNRGAVVSYDGVIASVRRKTRKLLILQGVTVYF